MRLQIETAATSRIEPLPLKPFSPLFALDDAALEAIGARRRIASAPNSAPCRVGLADADPGEVLILVSHVHTARRSCYLARAVRNRPLA